LFKKFLPKIINLRLIKEMASFRKSHVTVPHFPPADFVTKTRQRILKPRKISGKLAGSGPKVATGVWGEWLGSPRHLESPPPHSREFFFLPHSP
jgi:hypothetical protein